MVILVKKKIYKKKRMKGFRAFPDVRYKEG